MIQQAYDFDPAAFLAAARVAARVEYKPVQIAGLPPCFRRELRAGDIFDAAAHREALKAAGMELDRKVDIAIGLAQTLCGPSGEPIFDPSSREHVQLLIDLPWDSVRDLITGKWEGADPNPSTDGSNT